MLESASTISSVSDDSGVKNPKRSSTTIVKSVLATTVLPATTISFICLLLAILTCNFVNDEISGGIEYLKTTTTGDENNHNTASKALAHIVSRDTMNVAKLAEVFKGAGQKMALYDNKLNTVTINRYFGLFTATDGKNTENNECLLYYDLMFQSYRKVDIYANMARYSALIAITLITGLMIWIISELIGVYYRQNHQLLSKMKYYWMIGLYVLSAIMTCGTYFFASSKSIGCGDGLSTSRCRPGLGVVFTFTSFLIIVSVTIVLVRINKYVKTKEELLYADEERLSGLVKQESILSTIKDIEILRIKNIAIPASYLTVGFLQGFAGPLMNVYPIDLGASAVEQATVVQLLALPASFKILFGFLSDNFKFFGYRRKSYMVLGWLTSTLSMSFLLTQGENPSISSLAISSFFLSLGYWWADVMADTIVAERAKLEPEGERGTLQSTCYACRFFGLMTSSPFSTVLYSGVGPKYVISCMAFLPALMLPLIYFFEEKAVEVKSTSEQCNEIWKALCSRAVWQPLSFVFIYSVLQVNNSAWKEYLRSVLGFSSLQLNTILVAAYVMTYLGVITYKKFLMKTNWRMIYIWTTLLGGVFSVLQIMLILGKTFGLSNYFFALGDDLANDFVNGIQFLPFTIMMVGMTPDGSEGASYAMFTTISNSSRQLSGSIGSQLLKVWDVSKATLKSGHLGGFLNLNILTSCLQLSGILFVGLLPRNHKDLNDLKKRKPNQLGGAVFLFITTFSIVYSTFISILSIVDPALISGKNAESTTSAEETNRSFF